MFRANQKCLIAKKLKRDVYGQDVMGEPKSEGCNVLNMSRAGAPTNSNTQLSASATRALDEMVTAKLMLGPNTIAELDDQITAAGQVLRVVMLDPQYSTGGRLDHFLCGGAPWA